MAYIIIVALAVVGYLLYRRYNQAQTEQIETNPTSAQPATAERNTVAEPAAEPTQSVEAEIKPELEVAKEPSKEVVVASDDGVDAPDEVREFVTALEESNDPLVRHRLLQQITDTTYKSRNDAQSRSTFRHYAEQHVDEFSSIKGPLAEQNNGKLPQVVTFQNYATVLAEDGEHEKAVQVCQQALQHGLDDKTRTGFEGRIERIKTKAAKA